MDDGSTDGSFAALTRLHAAARERPRRPPPPQLRQGGGARGGFRAGRGRRRRHDRRRPAGRPGRDPAAPGQARRGLRPGQRLEDAAATTPGARRCLSKIFNCIASRMSGLRLHDMNCGFKAYRAEVVQGLRLYGELHRFIPVLAHDRGYRVAELPVNHRPREHGRSRYGVERYLRGFLDLLTVVVHGPLPAPPAAPLRRSRARSRRRRPGSCSLPDGRQDRRGTRSASGRCSSSACCSWSSDAALLARPDQRDDHEPPRGAAGAASGRVELHVEEILS